MSVAGTAAQHTVDASDIELVRATRAHDDCAFEELYRRYRGPIACYVRGWVHDDGRAEDVAQEAFVAALRRIRQTESEIRFKPWIYEIAKNAAIDQHRRRSRFEEVSIDVDGGLAPADVLRLAASGPPEASVIDKERFDHVRGALDELTETQFRVIVLRELEGLSYHEISERMQLSSNAVESALFRARRKFQSEYEQLDTGRRCALIRTLMARLAEGVEPRGVRGRLERHWRCCWACRRRARELGLEPAARQARRRAMALLPLPAFLRRFMTGAETAATGTPAREAGGMLASPAFESVAQGVHKVVVVIASAIAIGGGGATLGGVGPLAVDSGRTGAEPPAATRGSGPTTSGKTVSGSAKRPGERTGRRGERSARSEPSRSRSGRRRDARQPSVGGGNRRRQAGAVSARSVGLRAAALGGTLHADASSGRRPAGAGAGLGRQRSRAAEGADALGRAAAAAGGPSAADVAGSRQRGHRPGDRRRAGPHRSDARPAPVALSTRVA